jgi:hypothetical protein
MLKYVLALIWLVTRMLGRYQKNLGIDYWNGIKIYTRHEGPHANI